MCKIQRMHVFDVLHPGAGSLHKHSIRSRHAKNCIPLRPKSATTPSTPETKGWESAPVCDSLCPSCRAWGLRNAPVCDSLCPSCRALGLGNAPMQVGISSAKDLAGTSLDNCSKVTCSRKTESWCLTTPCELDDLRRCSPAAMTVWIWTTNLRHAVLCAKSSIGRARAFQLIRSSHVQFPVLSCTTA